MKPFFNPTYPPNGGIFADDGEWFAQRPWRRFRARPFQPVAALEEVTLCTNDESGRKREVNLVIVRYWGRGVASCAFLCASKPPPLRTDAEILRFLRLRGVPLSSPLRSRAVAMDDYRRARAAAGLGGMSLFSYKFNWEDVQ
ncbi:MAG: hypothetical protein WBO09_21230 [Methylocystis silviterrae]|uniref:hypothetical protein n=1 Tax=Methylocystis silviterrae TaxID=2743612 RepID=UPI003C7415DF